MATTGDSGRAVNPRHRSPATPADLPQLELWQVPLLGSSQHHTAARDRVPRLAALFHVWIQVKIATSLDQ